MKFFDDKALQIRLISAWRDSCVEMLLGCFWVIKTSFYLMRGLLTSQTKFKCQAFVTVSNTRSCTRSDYGFRCDQTDSQCGNDTNQRCKFSDLRDAAAAAINLIASKHETTIYASIETNTFAQIGISKKTEANKLKVGRNKTMNLLFFSASASR